MSRLTSVDELLARALRVTPGGVHSNVRLGGPARFIARGSGSRLWDSEGREYIDYALGQGPNILGHAHPAVQTAVADACQGGMVYAGQSVIEVEAAEAILAALRWPSMVRLGTSGTEMVQAALRLARAHTGRTKIVRFEGHYHGWLDSVLMAADANGIWGKASAGQVDSCLDDVITLPWNESGALADVLATKGESIAAVIMEPVMANSGVILPKPGYLQSVKSATENSGALLIFDEVITGFRVAPQGAAGLFGVTPDLAVYGKALGGGFPIAALAGPSDILQRLAIDTNHSGTFNANVMSCAAAIATLECLRTDEVYAHIDQIGTSLITAIRDLAQRSRVPLAIQGLSSIFHIGLGDGADRAHDWRSMQHYDLAGYASLSAALTDNGIWNTTRGIWFLSGAHRASDVAVTIGRFEMAMETWRSQR